MREPGKLPALPGQPRCRFCGVPMDRILTASRNNVCRMPDCERHRTREASAAIIQRDWDSFRDMARTRVAQSATALKAAAAEIDGDPDNMAIVVVPRIDRQLVPPDGGRRAALAEHLDTIIDAAFAGELGQEDMTARNQIEVPGPGFASAACASCQGFCCRNGASNFAYLDVGTIRIHRRHNPGVTAGEVREAYLGRLPETSVMDSCSFHGPQGCTLERNQRADICNRYFCIALIYLLNDKTIDHDGPFVMLAVDDEAAPTISTYSPPTGWQPREPVSGGAELTRDESENFARRFHDRMPQKPPLGRSQGISPPRRVCQWCSVAIDVNRTATTGSCGGPDCERQRISEIYRKNPTGGE